MKRAALRCVVDTNVPMTANGANPAAPPACVATSARALLEVMKSGHVFVDDGGLIVAEYRRNLAASGEPGPGDVFLKWLLTHEWAGARVTRVTLHSQGDDETFRELPPPGDGTTYDRSDRKFLAVAAAHAERPPILQALDSKWWGWQEALAELGVTIHFLCARAIEEKFVEKGLQ